MFEQSMLAEAPVNRGPIMTAMMLQAMGVGALLLAPLIWLEQLPEVPPLPPEVFAPRTLKAMKVFAKDFVRSSAAPKLNPPREFVAPPRIPTKVARFVDQPIVDFDVVDQSNLLQPGPRSPVNMDIDATIGKAAPPPPAPKPKPPVETVKETPKTVRISSMDPSKLIHQVKPAYPAIAKQAHIQGTVKLQAVISADGTIQRLQVISGHPLLVQAAVQAVQQWRYSPTLLGGNPVEVITQIDVNFVLGGR